ncbi:MAG: ABC transporter permease [Candidatus Acidiferrum sp.]
MKNFVALTRMRIQLTLRNKMFVFFSVIMPFGFYFLYEGILARSVPNGVLIYLGPVLALTVMGSFWGLSAGLVAFREQGILRRFHVTPVTASDMLASSIVGNFVLTLPTVLAQLLFTVIFFHTHHLGNLASIFVLITAGTISFGCLGLVVASVTNTMQETQVINQLLWLPLIFLSGATFPLTFLPKVIKHVAVFLPATYLVTGLQLATVHSAHFWQLSIEIGALSFWTILTFFVSAQLFRWEPDSIIPHRAKLWALATALPFIFLGVWETYSGQLLTQAESAYKSVNAPDRTPKKNTTPQFEEITPP